MNNLFNLKLLLKTRLQVLKLGLLIKLTLQVLVILVFKRKYFKLYFFDIANMSF